MAFQLPDLPYAKDALKPFLSEETFDFHHGKHHAAYVNNLNALAEDTVFADMELGDVIRRAASEGNRPVFNNSAQHWNHSFFWKCMSPDGGGAPNGAVAQLIDRDLGGMDAFREQFSKAAATLFGSGWAWLVKNDDGKLEILALPNADTPLVHGKTALLTLDVWEHAYYIDYRNARPRFIEGFWDVVNWKHVNGLLV